MGTQLAVPSFVSGAKDELATADAYKQTSTSAVNSIQDVTPNTTFDKASLMRGGAAIKDGVKSAADLARSGSGFLSSGLSVLNTAKGLQGGNLLSKLGSVSSLLSGPLSKLNPSLLGSVLSGVRDSGSIVSTIDGVSRTIKGGNLSNISSISGALNSLSNNSGLATITDKVANIGAMAGLVKTSCENGIYNTFGTATKALDNIDSVNAVANKCSESVAFNSDIGSFKTMGATTSPGSLIAYDPSILDKFSTNYTSPPAGDKVKEYADINGAFGSIKPDWTKSVVMTPVGPEQVTDVTVIQNGSKDIQKVIKTGAMASTNPDDKLLIVGTVFKPTTVEAEIAAQYPKTVFSSQKETVVVKDPNIVKRTTHCEDRTDGSTVEIETTYYRDGTKKEIVKYLEMN
jgi:hypothetical protein